MQSKRHPLVLLAQGPANPWWLAPVMTTGGLIGSLFSLKAWPTTPAIIGLCLCIPSLVVGSVWWRTRLAEWQFYKKLATEHNWSTCPICRYDLTGVDPSRCPECGKDLAALKEKLESKRGELF